MIKNLMMILTQQLSTLNNPDFCLDFGVHYNSLELFGYNRFARVSEQARFWKVEYGWKVDFYGRGRDYVSEPNIYLNRMRAASNRTSKRMRTPSYC